jgi:hypothetical protein
MASNLSTAATNIANTANAVAVSMAKSGNVVANHAVNVINNVARNVATSNTNANVIPANTFSPQRIISSITSAVPTVSYWFVFIWLLVLLLFVTLYYYIDMNDWTLTKWLRDREGGITNGWNWKRWWHRKEEREDEDRKEIRREERREDHGRDVGRPTPHKPWNKNETWCFVGEDLTGRACVKVPSPTSCDEERTFGTRNDCELQTANAMPSGVVKNGGTSMIPLASMGRML